MDLLTAILDDPLSRASTVLRDCGADLDEIRRALRTGHAPPRADRLPPALRPTRDMLIGRRRYRGRGLRSFLLSFVVRYASTTPCPRAVGLAGSRRDREAPRRPPPQGSRTLAAAGLTHARLAEAVATTDLGTDEVPSTSLVPRGTPWPRDTTALLRLLVTNRGNRSARLLTALGMDGTALNR